MHYKLYEPVIPSKNYFIMHHGRGECAVGTPSFEKLDMVERHGYPKMARAGFEFPFNIIAPQVYHATSQSSASYGSFSKYWPEWIEAFFNPDVALYSGLSLGGQYVDTLLNNKYHKGIINNAVVVCGKPDNSANIDPRVMLDIPTISVHGDKDNTVTYSSKKAWVEKVNALVPAERKNLIDFIVLPGIGHDSWTWAYSQGNKVWDFVHATLKNTSPSVGLDEFKSKAVEAIMNINY